MPEGLWRLPGVTRLQMKAKEWEALAGNISRLTALRELNLDGSNVWAGEQGVQLPPGLAACQQLSWLEMRSDLRSPVLARLHSLRFLRAIARKTGNDAFQTPTCWTQLTALTELQLSFEGPQSMHLGINFQGPQSMHPGLGGMCSLRKLSVLNRCNADSDLLLPARPYLSRLDSLSLAVCSSVPAVLAAATQLRHLDLSSKYGNAISLTAANLAVLGSLPALETLRLGKPQ